MVEQPPSADAYSALEQRLREPARALLGRIYHPLVLLLAWLGVSPNLVSFSQIPLGLLIVIMITPHPRLALLLIVASIAIDGIDGALARHLGRATPFGALWDGYCDHVREVLVVAGLAWVGALNGFWAALYGLAYPGINLTISLCNHYKTPIPLAIKSYITAYPFIFLYLWWGINWLDWGIGFSVLTMFFTIAWGARLLHEALG
jgi:phosphatidylglycerophosphate synthase